MKSQVTSHKLPHNCKQLRGRQVGFTLMELLLAITLFSVIAVAIYSSLAAGIKVQKKSSYLNAEYNDFRLAFYRIALDLRNAVHINDIYLVEESRRLYFYSIQPSLGGAGEIFKITYTWESEKDYLILSRLKEKYADSLRDAHEKGDKILSKIAKIDFDYGYFKKTSPGKEDFYWRGDWKEESMPKLVRLKIRTKNEELNKVIFCPAGKLGEIKEE